MNATNHTKDSLVKLVVPDILLVWTRSFLPVEATVVMINNFLAHKL